MPLVSVFNGAGQLVGPIEVAKVVLSDETWRGRLTPEQFRVLRTQGTERPFCGTLLDNKQTGVYTCAGCGLPLFESGSKFNSGTGWPSFFQPIAPGNVIQRGDNTHGMSRTEILCARCDGHLGHVFNDGPRPTGLRFCLNSESLHFTPQSDLAALADPVAEANAKSESSEPRGTGSTAAIVLAGGCFWCTEAAFEAFAGVLDVESGYAGGAKETATYQKVCEGNTGHAEVIRVTYDPGQITLDQLLDIFFDAHDPTQLNRQGHDVGTQYRSAIFYADDAQKQAAQAKINALTQAKAFKSPIVTKLEPLVAFYPAEDYHQGYAQLHPNEPYVASHAIGKACQVQKKHASLMPKPTV